MATKPAWIWACDHTHDEIQYRQGLPVPDFGEKEIEQLRWLRVIVAASETPTPKPPKLREPKPAPPAETQPQEPAKVDENDK